MPRAFMRWIAIAALAAMAPAALAMQTDTGFGLGVEYSDNIALAPRGAEKGAWTAIGSLLASLSERTSEGRYTLLGNIQYHNYQGGPFSNDLLFFLRATGSKTLEPGISEWRVEDYFDQTSVNVINPFTPTNRQNSNAFSTGPEAHWRLSSSQSLVAGARYSNFYFEKGDTNSQRIAAYASWIREMNSRSQFSLNGKASSTDFTSAAFTDYKRGDLFLRLTHRWASATADIDAGSTTITRSGMKDLHRFLGRVGWRFYPNSYSGLEASVVNEYTDAGQDILQAETHEGLIGPAEVQVTGDIFYSKRASLAYHWDGTRTHWIAAGEGRDDDYQNALNNRRYREGRGGVGYDLTPTLRASFDGIYRRSDYFVLGQVTTDHIADLFFNYRINSKSSAALHMTHTVRESNVSTAAFRENHLLLTYNYGLGAGLFGGLGLDAIPRTE